MRKAQSSPVFGTSGTRIRPAPSHPFYGPTCVRHVRGHSLSLHPRPWLRVLRSTTTSIPPLGENFAVTPALNSMRTVVSEPSTPPSTGAAPPSELSPTHEIPSKILVSTSTPRKPRPSRAEVSAKMDTRRDFEGLIGVLDDLSPNGDPGPQPLAVSPLLRDGKPDIFDEDVVTKFNEYVELAVEAGVVTPRMMRDDNGRLEPFPTHCDPPVHSSPPASTISTPPTHEASTTSPFTPLVDFLKSKQSTSAQPISFADTLDHFVSTLGYPDLLYLYTSVPGVKTFSQYIDAAIASGLISLVSGTTASRDARISLRDAAPPPSGVGPLQLPASIYPAIPDLFEPLISNLTKLWYEGKREPTLSEVHPLLLAQGTMVYGRVGASSIEDYVIKAAAANLVIYDPLPMPGRSFMATTIRLCKPPDDPPPPAQPKSSTTSLPSLPPPRETAASPPSVNIIPSSFKVPAVVPAKLQAIPLDSELDDPDGAVKREEEIGDPPVDPEPNPTISDRGMSPTEEASPPVHSPKQPLVTPTLTLQPGVSGNRSPISTVRTPTSAVRAEDPKRKELLDRLLSVKSQYDDLQKAFRGCYTALKEVKESLSLVSQNDTVSLVRITIQRLDDFNEDTLVELEIRSAEDERVARTFRTLLSAEVVISDEEMVDLEDKITAFVQGTGESASRAMQQFLQKLDDLAHDIASIKVFVRSLPDNVPEPPKPPGIRPTLNPSLFRQQPPSRVVSAAPTFGPMMTTPRSRHAPSLPHLCKSPPEMSDPLAGLHLPISMPTPIPTPSSPHIARPPPQRRAVSAVHMLGFGHTGGLLNSLNAGRGAPLIQTPVSEKVTGATDSDTSEDIE